MTSAKGTKERTTGSVLKVQAGTPSVLRLTNTANVKQRATPCCCRQVGESNDVAVDYQKSIYFMPTLHIHECRQKKCIGRGMGGELRSLRTTTRICSTPPRTCQHLREGRVRRQDNDMSSHGSRRRKGRHAPHVCAGNVRRQPQPTMNPGNCT